MRNDKSAQPAASRSGTRSRKDKSACATGHSDIDVAGCTPLRQRRETQVVLTTAHRTEEKLGTSLKRNDLEASDAYLRTRQNSDFTSGQVAVVGRVEHQCPINKQLERVSKNLCAIEAPLTLWPERFASQF
jgi:hypothetical protein